MGLSEVAEGFSGRLGWGSGIHVVKSWLHGLDLLLRIDSSDVARALRRLDNERGARKWTKEHCNLLNGHYRPLLTLTVNPQALFCI